MKVQFAIILVVMATECQQSSLQNGKAPLIKRAQCPPFSSMSWDYPPYTTIYEEGKLKNVDHSIMHLVLKDLLLKCCRGNTTLDQHFTSQPGIVMEETLPENISFAFPVSRNMDLLNADEKISEQIFVPLIISPGAVYIKFQASGGYILDILMQMWPLSILIIVATGFAGIIIWALDSRKNKDEFEPTFLRGFSDGIWWAFVSMTTVGYGDKTPRSILGRLFGILWIMIGISIIAVFQSSITTALNFIQQPLTNIHNHRVAVIAGTEDYVLALKEGAILQECDGAHCLYDLLDKRAISGFVVDFFVEKHARQMSKEKNTEFVSAYRIDTPVAHGILMQGIPDNLKTCFIFEARKQRSKVYQWLHAMSTFKLTKDKYSSPSDVAQDILYLDGQLVVVYSICTGILAFLIMILVVWDLKFRPYSKVRRASFTSTKQRKTLDQLGADVEGRQRPAINHVFEKQDSFSVIARESQGKY